MDYCCSVKLTREARDKVEAIRDKLESDLHIMLTLDYVVSTLISQFEVKGMVF